MESAGTGGDSGNANGIASTTTTAAKGGNNSSSKNTGGPIRLSSVQGYETRTNDIIYCPPLEKVYVKDGKELQNHAVVYFGGDIQDFPENMQVHHDSKAYIKYNLENTALMLRKNFPTSHIVVIKAVRMEFKTFSCYDNFVRGCNAGIPDHTPMNYALQHLEKLLQNVSPRIKAIPEEELITAITRPTAAEEEIASAESGSGSSPGSSSSKGNATNSDSHNHQQHDSNQDVDIEGEHETNAEATPSTNNSSESEGHSKSTDSASGLSEDSTKNRNGDVNAQELLWWRDTLNMDKAELTLIAFSKGSVVLNQLIYEFHYIKTLTPDDCSMMRLVSRIRAMYWLDGGHSAPKNTWITSRSLLETLERLNVSIHVHVTPYQVLDDRRPWIRRDEKAFTDLLKRLGANMTRVLHFDSGTTNLFTHFEVLEVFRQYELQTLAAEQALEEAKAAAAVAAAAASAAEASEGGSSEANNNSGGNNNSCGAESIGDGTTTVTAVPLRKMSESEAMDTGLASETEVMSDDCSN